VSGERAGEIGLVGHVVPDGEALARAHELAERIAANGPLAVRGIKAAVQGSEMLPEEEAFKHDFEIGMAVMASEDAREGPRAFLEKRPAQFKGR
jgi:enoyl-CoA hydratase